MRKKKFDEPFRKVSDKQVMEDLCISRSKYYRLKTSNPRAIELIKKGLLLEQFSNSMIVDTYTSR